jgi:hypothetical protein
MKVQRLTAVIIAVCAAWPLAAQGQASYTGTNVTGQLVLARTVNVLQTAQRLQMAAFGGKKAVKIPETPKFPLKRLRPPLAAALRAFAAGTPLVPGLGVQPAGVPGFDGLTHLDQRLANNGNQFSVEPPNPSIAVANGFVLLGVNNAFQVYTESGTPLLATVLSSNELFGVPAAIDRVTGINGVFPTDMRVFHDQTINRWFVLQRAQDYDVFGNPVVGSHIYMAVSQTPDPVGTYNIYEMDTTDIQRPGCPCFADYPQIGADEYGFYISTNEFDTFFESFVGAQIHAVSKAALGSGAVVPTTYRFALPFTTGFEFAIQPATTPPGASFVLGSGGVEYFVSSNAGFAVGNSMAVWAMYNTSTLRTSSPNLTLAQINVPTITYVSPDPAAQRPGPLPYGSTLFPPGKLAFLDGGDQRIQSLSYAGGRLYATVSTQVTDTAGRSVVGAAYVVFSPAFRSGTLRAQVLRQGYLAASNNNHILRPAVAVNPQGRGAIAFTLVGPDYYPGAAFVAFDTFSTGSFIQLARPGAFPEDGFTGYPGGFGTGVARWGDYSAAVAASNGAVWMVTEYIPNAPRTELANWGTYIVRYMP